jgi:Mlc titration factor MtfA (ptsG expression regulator)
MTFAEREEYNDFTIHYSPFTTHHSPLTTHPMIPFLILLAIVIFAFYFFTTKDEGKKKAIAGMAVETSLLEKNVLFYSKLDPEGKKQFEEDILFFLQHVSITGVDTPVEELDRLLVASAAVIPIFYFKKWKYHNLREVLLYNDAMNMQFETSGNQDRNILGMVGTGPFEGSMMISKPALRQGFSDQSDKHNTAIHEFVHLIDKSDGETDGIPELLLDKQYVLPWLDLMHEQMQEIAKGKSDIDAYAYTNKTEFLAVVAEYFFERPELLEENHPQLFAILKEMFDTP